MNRSTKIVLGVDTSDMYVWAVDLVSRLRFTQPLVTLLHATSKDCPIADADVKLVVEYGKFIEDLGVQALRQAQRYANSQNLEAATKMEFGRAADVMIKEAAGTEADLIALCAVRHGDWNKGYLGSAACALALYGDQSLLIAKTPVDPDRELRAVLALDHSSATDGLLDRFSRLSPKGISEILVVTAYGIDDETLRKADASLPSFGEKYNQAMCESVDHKNGIVVERLRELGYTATALSVRATPNVAIRESMDGLAGDILVLGSTGASSMPNARIGSFALNQISSEKYSVLMLRI